MTTVSPFNTPDGFMPQNKKSVTFPACPVILKEWREIPNANSFDQDVISNLNAIVGKVMSRHDMMSYRPIFRDLGIETDIMKYFRPVQQ